MRTATVFRRVLGISGPAAPPPPPPNLAPAFRIQDQHRHSPQFRFPGLPGIWPPHGEPAPALQAIPPVCALAVSPVREVCASDRDDEALTLCGPPLAWDPTDNGPALRWPKTLKPRCEAMVGGGWQWHPSGPRPRAVTATMASANMAVVWPCGPRRFVTVCLSWRLVDQSLPTTSFGVVAAERPSRAWAVPGLGGWADPR